MAIKYLNHIDLSGNELRNFLVQPLGTDPTALGLGHLITNTATANEAVLKYWDGNEWRSLLAPDANHKIVDSLIASAATWNAKYTKPSEGIPNTDLANSSVTVGSASVALGGSVTLSDIGVPTWAQAANLTFSSLPAIYVGTTAVQSESKAQALSGISSIDSLVSFDTTNKRVLITGTATTARAYNFAVNGTAYISSSTTIAGATTISNTLTVGSSSANKDTTLYGTLNLAGTTKRIYLGGTTATDPYIEWDATNKAIHIVNAGLYADTFVSALGTGGPSGGGGGSSTLYDLNDVVSYNDSKVGRTESTAAQSGDLLMFNGSKWHAVAQSNIVPTLSSLTIEVNGTSKGTYNPTDNAAIINITAADLGLSNATTYLGTIDTTGPQPTDGGTQKPTKDGATINPKAGDIVVVGSKEFIWTASGAWELFGDEGSYALKTISISGGKASGHTYGLTGGGTLESNRTITLDATTNTAIGNGVTAYGWGNHASAGYLTSDTAKSTYASIKTYEVAVGSTTNTVAYDFANANIVVSVYQGENMVMADVAIKKNSSNKYGVQVTTASAVTTTKLTIVAHGILA